ncbi:MAG: Spy/CpxP family protein refolding chaperone [Oceanospirillaceae bacterium]|nr:Spy/CpxP family protein refolding chaperone [Oceanospirillaceae bacterium]
MRKPLMIALTALTLSAATAGIAAAHEKGDGGWGRHNPEKRMQRMAEELGLSDEQRSQMQALMEQEHGQRTERGSGRETFRKLRNLDPSAADYQQQLDELVKQAQDQVGERIRARAAHRAAVAEILTDEQEQKLKDWKAERREGWKEHHGKGDHHGGRHHGDCDNEA